MPKQELNRKSWKQIKYNIRRAQSALLENTARAAELYDILEPTMSGQCRMFFDAYKDFFEQWDLMTRDW